MDESSLATLITVIGTIAAALVAAAATWLSTRIQHRGKPEHALIDQLQETMADRDAFYRGQIADIKATAQEANERAGRAEDKATKNERVNISLFGYAHRLRNHIEMEYGPPAPDWPDDTSQELRQWRQEN